MADENKEVVVPTMAEKLAKLREDLPKRVGPGVHEVLNEMLDLIEPLVPKK